MIQLSRKGIDPLSETAPAGIDNNFAVGYSYARQMSVRVIKRVGSKSWAGFAVENPQMVLSYQCAANVMGAAPASCPTMMGLETHPSPKFDFYVYAGNEYYQRTTYTSVTPLYGGSAATGGTAPIAIGYGIPLYQRFTMCRGTWDSQQRRRESSFLFVTQPRRLGSDAGVLVPLLERQRGNTAIGGSYSYVHHRLWAGLNGSNPASGHSGQRRRH